MNPVRKTANINNHDKIFQSNSNKGLSFGMKILMFSADPQILDAESAAAKRMGKYRIMLEAESPGSRLDIFLLIRRSPAHKESNGIKIFSGRFLRFKRAFIEAHKILKTDKYDLITAQDIEHSFIAYLLAREFGIPWQMQIHTDIFNPRFYRYSLFNMMRMLFARFLIPKAPCIRVVSERIKKSIIERFGNIENKIRILPISVEPEETNVKPKNFGFKNVVLTVARLESEKNIPLAIEAMTHVIKEEPETCLVIVGGGSKEKNLKSLAENFRVSGKIRFEGNQNDLVPYYRGADVYLQTSLYEGFGIAVKDAMRFGLPIVMTDVGVAGWFVEDGQNGFIRKTAFEIAEAIVRFLRDKNLRNEFGKKSKMFIKMNDESEYFPEVIRLWKQCAGF